MAFNKGFFVTLLLLAGKGNTTEGMPQFDASTFPSQLFWLVVTFLILYICLTFLVLPRIRENIRLRKNKISNDIERASNLKNQTEKMLIQYDKKISDTRNKANDLIKKSSQKANADLNNQISLLKSQIEKKINATEVALNKYKQESLKNIAENSSNLSAVIIKKLFNERLERKELDNLLLNKKEL